MDVSGVLVSCVVRLRSALRGGVPRPLGFELPWRCACGDLAVRADRVIHHFLRPLRFARYDKLRVEASEELRHALAARLEFAVPVNLVELVGRGCARRSRTVSRARGRCSVRSARARRTRASPQAIEGGHALDGDDLVRVRLHSRWRARGVDARPVRVMRRKIWR